MMVVVLILKLDNVI